jgi:hypothetical protein
VIEELLVSALNCFETRSHGARLRDANLDGNRRMTSGDEVTKEPTSSTTIMRTSHALLEFEMSRRAPQTVVDNH